MRPIPSQPSLKQVFAFLFFFCCFSIAHAQINQWTWVGGDNLPNKTGVYGTKGTPDAGNIPGGRSGAAQWKDGSGNFWLMGGFGLAASGTGNLNDLWMYSTSTNRWTWVSGDNAINPTSIYGTKGTADVANKPGGRSNGASFSDAAGNLWLMGGYNSGYYNDLWKFIPSTTQWTWVSGDNTSNKKGVYGTKGVSDAANKPGGRYSGTTCTDTHGDIWLFGGYGYASAGADSYLNDLWKFSPATGQWTWVSGDNTLGQVGVYGTKGTPSTANKPGARYSSVMWTDAGGNIWLFGGTGFALTSGPVGGELNDLWKFNPSTGEWTWMSGDNAVNSIGVYGTLNTPAAANKPGGRHAPVIWQDLTGNIYLFGGNGFPSTSLLSNLNDLWKLNLSSGEWTWIGGSNTGSQKGTYGVKGTPSGANTPGGRSGGMGWIDASGKIWLFGGNGIGSTVATGNLNDLWTFTLPDFILPVTFSNFTAQQVESSVVLNWSTAQEQNSDHFDIERSFNGVVFDHVGKIPAAGNSQSPSNYSFTDPAPLPGINFYRLKQSDRDGDILYSKIVSVTIAKSPAFIIKLLQNPVQTNLKLELQLPSEKMISLGIKDISGNLLMKEQHSFSRGTSTFSLPVAQLSKGVYYLVLNTDGHEETKKFIKL
jgi:N-acetylneuraminic acid mutarotase